MAEKIKNEISNNRQNIFWFLAGSIFLMLGLYLFFVGHTVYDVVLRQETEKTIAKLETLISDEETNYVKLTGKITPDMAEAKGFRPVTSSARFIAENASAKTLSLNSGN